VHGSPWGNVNIRELSNHGAVDNARLARGELWRLLTAQFIHVNQWHMLFNVITLFLLSAAVERATGPLVLAFLWLLSGATGMYASIYSVPPPLDVGTGASQALMGVAAASVVVIHRNRQSSWLKGTLIVTLVFQFALDLRAVHYPKPGHVVGFLVGLILATFLVPKSVHQASSSV
jgi:membrane associated rhomboid family serine protease